MATEPIGKPPAREPTAGELSTPDGPAAVAEPRPAAAIVLVRPSADGLEVLLTRRPDSMAFAAGLHVFPGGRVEAADGQPRLIARSRGPLDDPGFRVVYRIAAIRETWEEVGVLLADPSARSLARSPELDARDDQRFAALIDRLDLTLRTDDLVEIAYWTTPRYMPRRFAARFFVAELPPGVVIRPDPHEVAAYAWLTPRAALSAMAAGSIAMWPPTSTTLQRLERAATFAAIREGLGLAPEPSIGIQQIDSGLRVMTGQSAFGPGGRPANTVLVGRRDVVVVDPGDPGEAFLDAIETEVAREGGRVVAIGITHVDPGHAAGSEDLHTRTGAPILVGPGGAAALSWAVTEVGDGATLGVGDGILTALTTPGHRPDHVAFLAADATLIAGDALTDRPAIILPPEGDQRAQRRTQARLRRLVADGTVTRIVPGHGPALLEDPTAALATGTTDRAGR